MAEPDPYAAFSTVAPQQTSPGADPYAAFSSVQAQQLPPVVYAQPVKYEGHPEDYVWDDRLPDPGQGMAWPKGTIPDQQANSAGNSVAHLPGDPKAYFGRPLYVDPQTQDAVNQLLNTAPPGTKPPNAVTDAAMSAGSGSVRGLGYLLTSPGDLTTAAEHGISWLGDRVMENLPPELGGWSKYHSQLNEYGSGPKPWDGRDTLWPTTQDFQAGVSKALGPNQELYEPKTGAGKIVNSIAELLPSTVAGGEGIAQRVLPALAGGTLGQLGEDVTRGTDLEPWGRLVGTAGGAGFSGALTQPVAAETAIARAYGAGSKNDLAEALALMQRGDAMGVRISPDEAFNQVSGGAYPGATNLRRVAENSPEGQPIFGQAFADRPQALAQALRSTVLDPLAPETFTPSALGPRAQNAATTSIRDVEKARTAAVTPSYKAAASDTVPLPDMEALLQRIDADVGADKTGIIGQHAANLRDLLTERPAIPYDPGDPLNGIPPTPGSPRVPITDIGNLDRIRKFQRDTIAARAVGQDAIPAEQAGQIGSYLDHLDGLMEANSPAFRQGKAAFGKISDQVVTPVTAGPLGTIANTGDVSSHTSALFPKSPLPNARYETAFALANLDRNAPGLAADLARQHLEGNWNAAVPSIVPNDPYVGARWYKNTLGNPEQRATTLGGVEQAGGSDLADALANFGDVSQATGYRPRAGSMTAWNEQAKHDLSSGGFWAKALKAFDLPEIPRMIGDKFSRWQLGRNVEGVANSFATGTPDDQAKIIAQALKNHPTTAPGWASKLLLYDNPVLPGRGEKKEAASAP